jgi:NAD(P)-dependent dehydrogenase (short-subunit alcohol dehydrogenase family)
MKTVVITGISRGIGKVLTQKFLNEGYFVIGTTRSGTSELSNENFFISKLDLANPESIRSSAEGISKINRQIDILINNAATMIDEGDGSRFKIDALRETLEVNVIGQVDFTQRLVPFMAKDSHIVNLGSGAGSFGHQSSVKYPSWKHPSYKVSKAALHMVTKIWANKLKDKTIVSAIYPGWVKTDMGGNNADLSPEEAAEDVYKLAVSKVETGQFWYKGEIFPW